MHCFIAVEYKICLFKTVKKKPCFLQFLFVCSVLIEYTLFSCGKENPLILWVTLHVLSMFITVCCTYIISLEGFLFHKIPDPQRSQVHVLSSPPWIVQSGALLRED